MIITNKGAAADRLIGGTSPIAKQLEVHQMTMDKGIMSMRPVLGGLEIKPGQTVVLKPESVHIMLIGLKQPLAQGERVNATLDFAIAGKVDLQYVVEQIGAQVPASMDHGTMEHAH